jgi:hypothetical protein
MGDFAREPRDYIGQRSNGRAQSLVLEASQPSKEHLWQLQVPSNSTAKATTEQELAIASAE